MEDIVLWGQRVVVPRKMQKQVLEELHSGHNGIVKMKGISRQYVWWPSIADDIEIQVKSCETCQLYASSAPSQDVKPWPPADIWQRVHLDYASINGKSLLVLVDAGSKWMEAKFMSSTTSYATLLTLYEWFGRFGYPNQIHTDGGPQFTSSEFSQKIRDWGIKLTVSPPYSPSSNGAAERAVRILKEGLKKSTPLNQILFCYRDTPLSVSQKTPAELMLGRALRTRLSAMKPSSQPEPILKKKVVPGDLLWIRDFRNKHPKWQKAQVVEQIGRSVLKCSIADGSVVKRHVNHSRKRLGD